MIPVWIATITVLDENDAPKTLYFGDSTYIDDDWNLYKNRMAQPALVKVSADDGGTFHCFSSPSIGEIELINVDGGLNYLTNYAVDNGTVSLSLIDENGFQIDYLTGKVLTPHSTDKSIFLTLQSMSELLSRNHPNKKYAGNNVLPAGTEGVATDLKGNIKPRIFGSNKNQTPIFVNTARLIYQFSDRQSGIVTAVYDKGGALTLGTTFAQANFSTFETAAPTAGTFNRCGGFIKLGASPVGAVTGDAFDGISLATSATSLVIGMGTKTFSTQAGKNFVSGNTLTIYSAANPANFMNGTVTSYATTSLVMNIIAVGGSGTFSDWIVSSNLAGDVFNEIVKELTFSPAITFDASGIKALNTVGEIGILVNAETSTASLLNQIISAIGGIWFFTGYVISAQLIALATTYTLEITDSKIISLERTGTGLGTNDLPITAFLISYDKNLTVQNRAELVSMITDARVSYLSQESRSAFVESTAVLSHHPMAEAITISGSVLRNEADALAVATRLLNLAAARVDVVNITVMVERIPALAIGQGILVTTSKLGYDDGKILTIIGFEIDAKRKRITLETIG
jgi:hypothetical protein